MTWLTPSQMNTAAAKARKQRIEDHYQAKKARFTAGKKKQKAKKKASSSSASQPHASDMSELEGVLAKDAYYAQNCHDYLHGDGGRNVVYKEFDADFAVKHSSLGLTKKQMVDRFKFPNDTKHPENFNPGAQDVVDPKKKAGQKYPYVWEAHHMLPGSAFYYEDASGHCFEPWQIQIILQSKYNLNHGHNMIPLPDLSDFVPIHQLPQHPGDHPVYTQLVMQKLHAIAKRLAKLKSQKKPHQALKDNVFQDLRQAENDTWDLLIKLGKSFAAAKVAGKRVKDAWASYGTQDDPSKYPWGSLG
jgi:HNH/ENDO VII superfamily nuclease